MGEAVCPRCTRVVALHEGRPFVSTTGAIELWHSSCWAGRDSRIVEELTLVAPPLPSVAPSRDTRSARTLRSALVTAVAGAAFVAVAIASYSLHVRLPPASLATINFETTESLAPGARLSEREIAPAALEPRDLHPVPVVDGQPLDELYPSLIDWIHPVADTDDLLPPRSSASFGAVRRGVDRTECGGGHCGVDLVGPIGRPVVAVGDGVVVRIERSEMGRDGRSGRYVRIEHADGTLTAYMHLDEIVDGLEVGDRVDGGQQIGTLGASGIHTAAPHVHFALELPNTPGTHGDHSDTHYVDPVPFLARASIAHGPTRRHAQKPAM